MVPKWLYEGHDDFSFKRKGQSSYYLPVSRCKNARVTTLYTAPKVRPPDAATANLKVGAVELPDYAEALPRLRPGSRRH